MRNQRRERSFARVGAGMQLVNNGVAQCDALPCLIGPGKRARVNDLRSVMHSVRLKARRWVRPTIAAIQPKRVASAGLNAIDDDAKVSRRIALHRDQVRERTSRGE